MNAVRTETRSKINVGTIVSKEAVDSKLLINKPKFWRNGYEITGDTFVSIVCG